MASRELNTSLTGYTSADFILIVTAQGVDADTGETDEIDVSSLDITFTVEDMESASEIWEGTVGDGITLTGEDGEFKVWIPLTTMQGIKPDDYNFGCVLSDGTYTTQFMRGTLTVLDGIV